MMDYEKLTTIEKESQDVSTALIEVIQQLSERVTALERSIEEMGKKKAVSVSDQEQIIILLQQMTKFGQCEERAFKEKAKSYGFSKELADFAIESLKLNRDVANGKVWLTGGKK